jgi:hypothetical protein
MPGFAESANDVEHLVRGGEIEHAQALFMSNRVATHALT